MNLLRLILSPVTDVAQAIVMPFKALFVIGLTAAVNAMTYNGQWWFKWVALGMGIAVLMSFARAAKTLLVLAIAGWAGNKVYQRYQQKTNGPVHQQPGR